MPIVTKTLSRKAQLINPSAKFDATHQVEIDGSVTKDVDNDVQWTANLDRKEVGCPYTSLYWIERIFQALRDKMFPGVDEAFASVVAQAKAKGLSEGQEDDLKRYLMYMGFGLKDAEFNKDKILKETEDGLTRAESNSYLYFPQHQVAASLRSKACYAKALVRLEGALERYASNKPKIHKGAITKKIASLKSMGFSNEEISNEVDNWGFSKELKKAAKASLSIPKDTSLSSIPRLANALTNGKAKVNASKKREAATKITQNSWLPTESNSFEQETAVRKLALAYERQTPLWVVSKSPLKVAALLKGNRVLVAEISDKGEVTKKASLDKNFKNILAKSKSKEEAWVTYASKTK